MANTFNIVISATDKATATVRKVNDAFDRMARPFKDVGKSFRSLGKELHLPAIGRGISAIGGVSIKTARSLTSMATPLAAITGVATLAGMTVLVDRWANFGRATTYAAQGIGITTTKLQQMQGIGALAGISADSVTSSLESLGTVMQDARWGRNQGALMLLNRVGVGLKRTKDGAWDVVGEMTAIAKVMTSPQLRNNPYAQALLANQLGVSAMLPVLRQGEAGIARYAALQKRLGYVSSPEDIRNADAFALSISGMKMAVEGLGQSVMDKAMPALQPFVDGLATWVANNRELISQDVAGVVKRVAEYIQGIDWKEIGNNASQFLVGVKDSLKDIGEAAKDIASVFDHIRDTKQHFSSGLDYLKDQFAHPFAQAKPYGDPSGGGMSFDAWKAANGHFWQSDSEQKALYGKYQAGVASSKIDTGLRKRVMDYFQGQGWSQAQAAGIAANLATESSLNPNASGDNGAAFGVGQWHADRQKAFEQWSGHSIRGSSLLDQLGFVQYELTKGNEQNAGSALRGATSADQAGAIVSSLYERPADAAGEASRRGYLAASWMNGGDGATQASAPAGPYAAGSPNADSAGASQVNGRVHVEVTLPNAPPGTQAKVKSTDGSVTASTRIGYSGVGAIA
ncbi:hypothetical protein DyAD56_15835 [Dyella sp. AD56]|uniref:phage tail tip lysozyme n=1 Tax=Dyella sp. AD56 TaxID=1528744 RepID=UPI000C81AF48|nr:phage tail tip lysozyme [Dyella sp. AD56]PMQ04158.1 hypothetical protein DyAD56_15835 [Dyella sp. AD56]